MTALRLRIPATSIGLIPCRPTPPYKDEIERTARGPPGVLGQLTCQCSDRTPRPCTIGQHPNCVFSNCCGAFGDASFSLTVVVCRLIFHGEHGAVREKGPNLKAMPGQGCM